MVPMDMKGDKEIGFFLNKNIKPKLAHKTTIVADSGRVLLMKYSQKTC